MEGGKFDGGDEEYPRDEKVRSSFEEAYKKYCGEVRSYISCRVFESDVDDLAQKVWVVVSKKFDEYDRKNNPIGWIIGITSRTIRNHWRVKRREEENRVRFSQSNIAEFELSKSERRELVELIATCLDDDETDLLNEYFYNEKTFEEIGMLLGCSRATAHRKWRAVRNKLIRALEA